MYLVLAVKTKMKAIIFGKVVEMLVSSAGFYGLCPVFEFYEDAVEFADGKAKIVEVQESPKEAE